MQSQVNDVSPVVKQLNVVVDGATLTRELDKAYRKVGDKARIPGFRAGRIPRQVLEHHFRGQVESEVLGRVIGDAYRQAIQEHKVEPVAQPEINAGEFVPGQDFSFTARVEVKPHIDLKDYKGLSAKATTPSVDDQAVEAEIERLRQQVSTIAPVEGRDTVQAHDLVTTNFSGTVDGEGFSGGQGSAYVIEPGAGRFLKEVEDALVGKKVGESFEVDAKLPDTFRAKEVAGKTAHFKVTVAELKTRNMPALDDDFAKDLGDYEGLEDLRKKLRESLEQRAKEQAEGQTREELMTQLIEKNPFELPPSLVERQIDAQVYRSVGRLNPQQLQRMGLDRGKVREDMREGATRLVRGSLLLEAIANAEKLEVSETDVEEYFAKTATATGQPVQRVRAAFVGDRREDLKVRLRSEKALDFLVKNANITPA
ncbi:MAG: trigger factor [Myxococcota bacterium]